MHPLAEKLSASLRDELHNILNYWNENSLDFINGGFVGERDHYNNLIDNASKGVILNSRILWSFSAACNHFQSNKYLQLCGRSFDYLQKYFKDEQYGGVFWELNALGIPTNSRKQIYAQAFMIYALSEYFICSQDERALSWAIELYEVIENRAKDSIHQGYTEAFNQDWSPIDDMRLSDKDENVAKSLNTHLHILEAYTNLYRVYKNEKLKSNLTDITNLFLDKFINEDNHLNLFFDEKCNIKGNIISYGHDIEAAWLLVEAARALNNKKIITETERIAILIADTFINEGLDEDYGVMYEFNSDTNYLDADKHWWAQAEALIGLRFAFDISGDVKYLDIALKIWDFIENNILDKTNGEWYWMLHNGIPSTKDYKMGMWKAPYHNSRACIKLI